MSEEHKHDAELEVARIRARYRIAAVLVWVAILIASAFILAGTPYLPPMIPVLGGGAVWFVIIAPAGFRVSR